MQGVILSGGEGTRLRPLTLTRPKGMVPVLNRPFLEHLLEYVKGHGLQEAILTIGYLPDKVQEYFGDGQGFGLRVTYGVEERPLGTAGAVKNVARHLGGTFFVFNGDIFTDLDLRSMLAYHRHKGAKATIALTPVEDPSPYGVVETDRDGRVQRFLEKPRGEQVRTLWINAGTYILEPEVLSEVPPGEPFMFETHLFPLLLQKGVPVYGYRSRAYWMDIGNPQNYLRLHRDLLLGAVEDPYPEGPKEGVQVHPEAQIQGPVVLGKGCSLAAGARVVGPSVLGPGCQLEADAVVRASVLWDGVRVGAGATLEGCIVASRVCIGQGAVVSEGCVLADEAVVGPGNRLGKGTFVFPGKRLEPHTLGFQTPKA